MTHTERDNIARAAIIFRKERFGRIDCPICKRPSSLIFYKRPAPGGGVPTINASCYTRGCVESTDL